MSIARLGPSWAARFCCACLASAVALAGNGTVSSGLAPPARSADRAARSTLLEAWTDLWRTPDQQAQAMLDAGEPAQAAARFHDPRRRAYADLEAGRYQEAARLLQPFTDAESEYNRGNALAHAGQLQAALAAYDAALKQAPADKDIQRNRDLVQRALRRQPPSAQSSPGRGKSGGQSSRSGQDQQAGQSAAGQQGARAAAKSDGGSRAGSSAQSGDRGSQGGHPASQGVDQRPQAGGSPADRGSPAAAGQLAANGRGNGNAASSGNTQGGAGQAERDAAAAAALAREQPQPQRGAVGHASQASGSGRNGLSQGAEASTRAAPDAPGWVTGGAQSPKQKPETERQLALDQWLRQIPDSPAGLLQRKFLIEHMIRQQEGDPQGDGR